MPITYPNRRNVATYNVQGVPSFGVFILWGAMLLSSLGRRLDRFAHRYMPDPFVLALILTLLVGLLGIFVGDAFPADTSFTERFHATLMGWKQYIFEPKRSDGT